MSSTMKAQKKRKGIWEQIDICKKHPIQQKQEQRPISEVVKDFMQYLHETPSLEGGFITSIPYCTLLLLVYCRYTEWLYGMTKMRGSWSNVHIK